MFSETPWKSEAISFRQVGAGKMAGDRADNEEEAGMMLLNETRLGDEFLGIEMSLQSQKL